MKLKGRFLGTAIAAAIVGLILVGTGSASAMVWKMSGTNVNTFFELPMTGGEKVEFIGAGDGVSCEIKATMTSSGGSAAKVTKWETKSCAGFGSLSSCIVLTSEAKGLPWAVTVESGYVLISGHHVRRTFLAKTCPLTEIDLTLNSVLNPDSLSSIKEFEAFGQTTHWKVFGSMQIGSPATGTTGIG